MPQSTDTEEMPHIDVDPKHVMRVLEGKLAEASNQNTLLLAYVAQLEEEKAAMQEVIDEIAEGMKNREERRAAKKSPAKKKGKTSGR